MQERRGSMYDPARDIFTAEEAARAGNTNAIQSPDSPADSHKRRRSSEAIIDQDDGSPGPAQSKTQRQHTPSDEPPAKKPKPSSTSAPMWKENAAAIPMTAANLSGLKGSKKKPSDASAANTARSSSSTQALQRGSQSPASVDGTKVRRRDPRREERRLQRRSPPARQRRSPSPKAIPRSPTPPPRSPPRERKRPGGGARVSAVDREAVRQRQIEREREQASRAQAQAAARGVHDVVRQHYNAVPQRGREWRKTDSKIKGLRSLNNWIKSAIIQKFSPSEDFTPGGARHGGLGYDGDQNGYDEQQPQPPKGLLVLDIGCGKGGDLQKWQAAPQKVDLYVGVDPAEVSIDQARDRYQQMKRGGGGRGGFHQNRSRGPPFHAEFVVKDAYGEWLGTVPIIQEVGIDTNLGLDGSGRGGGGGRWGGGGFDVVSMMFCMHYAFESEAKARGMLRNVAASLKKGGRFLGVIPNSDVLTTRVKEFYKKNAPTSTTDNGQPDAGTSSTANGNAKPFDEADDDDDDWDPEKPSEPTPLPDHSEPANNNSDDDWDPEKPSEPAAAPASAADAASTSTQPTATATANTSTPDCKEPTEAPTWGNGIYRVQFPQQPPAPQDGIFRPPFSWKYFYFLEEAVEEVPEYVVPWEAFRALAEEFNLELQYRKAFGEVWSEERHDRVLGPLSERMGVVSRETGEVVVSDEEWEAAAFYHAFCFYKV